ncbi:MAG: molecular chaperone HtpG, partial [Pseudomonadota bacterium]|nr:molecular chaperone HtpG [Pseudomonadota bacterium]
KVLQLMIHSLYTNRDIFLRELISNASDACDKLRYEALTNPDLAKDSSDFAVTIIADKDKRTLTVSDNGIGMNREELIENLGTIAKSGTQEFLGRLTGDGTKDTSLIGQFGVGFYSSFMAADKVTVVSTRAGSDESWQWESDGTGEFSVAPAEKSPRGTAITLHLKSGEDQYLDTFRLRHIVTTYSDHISFPIKVGSAEGEPEAVNTASAVWMRSKADVTPEQYKEFYHHVAHAPDEPWLVLHNKAEGKLEYMALLFIPSQKPFDLFHPDRKRRVKLYVRRVFITEENAELVPAYMRFLRGVVDSEDLPLNISRETLQHNPMMTKIRDALVTKVLAELKKKTESDEEGYRIFWANFGAVLKEGLCEAATPREQILEVCRFYSTHGTGTTSLDAYISRMKPEQEHIYYLTGDRLDALRGSPQLEGFAAKGIEVLLLADHVDDFWVSVVTQYKGRNFKSVTRADINLGEKKSETKTKPDDNITALAGRMKEILGDHVKDVRATSKLTSSAVCLAVDEGAMDVRLERFLVEQKQIAAASAKILEINSDHPIIRSLVTRLSNTEIPLSVSSPVNGENKEKAPPLARGFRGESSSNDIEDAVWLLFDQARIALGETIADPAAFTRRLQRFVEKGLTI